MARTATHHRRSAFQGLDPSCEFKVAKLRGYFSWRFSQGKCPWCAGVLHIVLARAGPAFLCRCGVRLPSWQSQTAPDRS